MARRGIVVLLIAAGCGEFSSEVLSGPGEPEKSELEDAGTEASLQDRGAAIDDGGEFDSSDASLKPSFDPDAACIPVSPDGPLPLARVASGTRLVPRRIAENVASGVEVPYSVFDKQLGTNCDAWRGSDGKFRCLPRDYAETSEPFYADAAKTIPVVIALRVRPPVPGGLAGKKKTQSNYGSYSRRFVETFSCGFSDFEFLGRVGALRPEREYYFGSPTTKVSISDSTDLYEVTKLPLDFVVLTEVRATVQGSVAARELHGSDGSRLFATDFYDSTRRTPLELDVQGPGDERLLPPEGFTLHQPHLVPPPDSGVTQAWCDAFLPISVVRTWGCGQPAASAPSFLSLGPNPYAVVKQSATFYECQNSGPESFILYSRESSGTFATPCASIPRSDWPAVTSVALGGGRLTTTVRTVAGLPIATRSDTQRTFTDSTLGISCSPGIASDGVLRCLPVETAAIYYEDAACTARVTAWVTGALPPPPAFVKDGSAYFQRGAAGSDQQVYFKSAAGVCTLFGSISKTYAIGDLVPPSSFVELELRDAPM